MKDCKNLQRFLDSSLKSTERASFEAHLPNCPACSGEVANAKIVEQSLREHARLEAAAWHGREAHLQAIKSRLQESRPSVHKTLPRAVSVLVAASIAVIIAAIFWDGQQSPKSEPAPRIAAKQLAPAKQPTALEAPSEKLPAWETPASQSRVVLFKGHQIGLGANSRLEVARIEPRRLALSLIRGTAAFDVAKQQDRGEFVVETTNLAVRVIGTRFSVEHSATTTGVVVNRGTVEVTELPTKAVHRVTDGSKFVFEKNNAKKPLAQAAAPEELQRIDVLLEIPSEKRIPAPIKARRAKQQPKKVPEVISITAIKKMVARGDLSQAELALAEHLAVNPMSVDANSLMGDLRQKESRWQDAADAYRRAGRAANTKAARRSLYKAGVLLQEKLTDHKGAVALFQQYVRHQPTGVLTADALLRQAKSLGALGRHGQRNTVLQQLITDHPGTPAALSARKLFTTP